MKARHCVLCALLLFFATNTFAQQCFTPANGANDVFVAWLEALVENYKDYGWKDYYICSPAFDTTYALTVEQEQLICKKIVDGKWSKRKKLPKYKTARWVLPIGKEEWRTLRDLLENATITANYYSYFVGHDGITYYLGSSGRLVSSWWPKEGTLPYRTVKMLDTVCLAVTSGDTALLQKQLAVCRGLTREFRLQYPLSYFYPNVSYHYDYSRSQKETKVFSVVLKSNYGRLSVKQFVNTDTNVAYKDFRYDAGALGDSMAVWRRELFLNEQEIRISILLSDTSGMRCCVNSDREVTMMLPKERLDRQVLFAASHLPIGYYELSPDGRWLPIPEDLYRWWPSPLSLFFW